VGSLVCSPMDVDYRSKARPAICFAQAGAWPRPPAEAIQGDVRRASPKVLTAYGFHAG